jgi:hypothetical protein
VLCGVVCDVVCGVVWLVAVAIGRAQRAVLKGTVTRTLAGRRRLHARQRAATNTTKARARAPATQTRRASARSSRAEAGQALQGALSIGY